MPHTPSPSTVGNLARAAGDLLIDIDGDPTKPIGGLAYDTRRVRPGDLFFCIRGQVADGHEFASAAASAGCAALCVERRTGAGRPEIVVRDSRRALGRVAAEFYGRPADALMLVAVTGTNGKTTTAYLIDAILRAAGHTTGLIGTVETRVAGSPRPAVRTTPESLDLQRLLAEIRDAGAESVVMEVTSHALALHRVEGLRFASAAFTNLSQDHLDFHAGMEDYFQAKRSLFVPERVAKGAVNLDDPYGRRLFELVGDVECIGFGHSPDAHVRAEDVRFDPAGTEFVLVVAGTEHKISTPLIGAFNVSNCLAAVAAALQCGIDLEAIERGLNSVGTIPGRFEPVSEGQPFTVVVDYAHTPDSLDNVLREARRLASGSSGRVICVFGCGGDRDRGKRPLMGAVAARLADLVIVTSDNPRSEDPVAIIDEILEGVVAEKSDGADVVEPDRRHAIAAALGRAREGDVVVIAGKGHETGQQFADITLPFDDREVARGALRAGAVA